MYINHVAIWTSELERLKDFYVNYFSGKAGDKYLNPYSGFSCYYINFDSGADLEIMCREPMVSKNTGTRVLGYAHIALSPKSPKHIDEITEKLAKDGFFIPMAPAPTSDKLFYRSQVIDPDGNTIELYCRNA